MTRTGGVWSLANGAAVQACGDMTCRGGVWSLANGAASCRGAFEGWQTALSKRLKSDMHRLSPARLLPAAAERLKAGKRRAGMRPKSLAMASRCAVPGAAPLRPRLSRGRRIKGPVPYLRACFCVFSKYCYPFPFQQAPGPSYFTTYLFLEDSFYLPFSFCLWRK